MPAQVITFSVELGSGGPEIARGVARALDYRYYDREVLLEAARLAEVSPETIRDAERWPGFIERMIDSLARTALFTDITSQGVVGGEQLTMTSADYRGVIEQVIRKLAATQKCVILGHAGQVILKEANIDVFRVFVHGSRESRAERLVNSLGLEKNEALQRIDANDKERVDFFRHVFGVDWRDVGLYDMTLDTDTVSDDAAVHAVLAGVADFK